MLKIEIKTNDGPDIALAHVLVNALEKTYKILPQGEAGKFSLQESRHQEQASPDPSPAHTAALAIGNAMRNMVSGPASSDHEISKVAHVAEIAAKTSEKIRS